MSTWKILDEDFDKAKIMALGVGGCGGNIISNIADSGANGIELISINTDSQEQNIIHKSKKIIISFLIFSLILGAMEFIRGTILTGFPWNLIAFSFSNQTEILSIISLIGTYGFNLFCISLFTCPALIILKNSKKGQKNLSKK